MTSVEVTLGSFLKITERLTGEAKKVLGVFVERIGRERLEGIGQFAFGL